ncbi:vWA domain-containing protein [Sphingomonas lenta]|uniref:VWFA domain-containing protein n=1 Tax=Sphingomonas lenta TaxID=1141887 RepID=A0A2A2SCD2_9SPHN|nr:VWA domain-containing protein [Sphingomonas lenta]PAX06873.1 hypothetical protein CKY28_12405 [Sphingomonas lenta]
MGFEQVPLRAGEDEFFRNAEPRCPVVLLLDNSQSMSGPRLDGLNAGLQLFRDELLGDELARKRVEVAVVSFGPVETVSDFQGAEDFVAPRLPVGGLTPMGEAIERGLDMIEQRKRVYRDNAIKYYRPWMFLITDGSPTDDWARAAQMVREKSERKALSFFAVGVEDADMATLARISVRPPVHLNGLKFQELFSWLSSSLQTVSKSRTDDEHIPLQKPDWGSV